MCNKCNGEGVIEYYHDAGDHFGGGTSPNSEWRTKPCDCVKCKITGNECGTDTWMEGRPCLCENCQRWLAENQKDLPPEFSKTVDEHFWELI